VAVKANSDTTHPCALSIVNN